MRRVLPEERKFADIAIGSGALRTDRYSIWIILDFLYGCFPVTLRPFINHYNDRGVVFFRFICRIRIVSRVKYARQCKIGVSKSDRIFNTVRNNVLAYKFIKIL